jgi:hypothetical protein
MENKEEISTVTTLIQQHSAHDGKGSKARKTSRLEMKT